MQKSNNEACVTKVKLESLRGPQHMVKIHNSHKQLAEMRWERDQRAESTFWLVSESPCHPGSSFAPLNRQYGKEGHIHF